jgi:hypothetical protein
MPEKTNLRPCLSTDTFQRHEKTGVARKRKHYLVAFASDRRARTGRLLLLADHDRMFVRFDDLVRFSMLEP